MNLLHLFHRPARNPGRELAQIGADKRRATFKATTDEMRARLGLPAWEWRR